jgi:(2Fe-2S) ferredoxin
VSEGSHLDRRRLLAAGAAARLGIGRGGRHIFLCADQSKPKCAPVEQTTLLWGYLKRRVRELGLDGAITEDACVHRSKVDCLRVCVQGPIAVVYPDGTWYANLDVEALERILVEHVIGGRPVESHRIAVDPLGDTSD